MPISSREELIHRRQYFYSPAFEGFPHWQNVPAAGCDSVRAALELDDRPVVLLATNLLGDSLTLGRNLICPRMSAWITRTVQFFTVYPDVQFVIRIHPGELLT